MPLDKNSMMGGPEGAEMDSDPNETQETEASTATLPASLFGSNPPSAGDSITLEVEGVDEDGNVTVSYEAPTETDNNEPPRKGIESLAAKFD